MSAAAAAVDPVLPVPGAGHVEPVEVEPGDRHVRRLGPRQDRAAAPRAGSRLATAHVEFLRRYWSGPRCRLAATRGRSSEWSPAETTKSRAEQWADLAAMPMADALDQLPHPPRSKSNSPTPFLGDRVADAHNVGTEFLRRQRSTGRGGTVCRRRLAQRRRGGRPHHVGALRRSSAAAPAPAATTPPTRSELRRSTAGADVRLSMTPRTYRVVKTLHGPRPEAHCARSCLAERPVGERITRRADVQYGTIRDETSR